MEFLIFIIVFVVIAAILAYMVRIVPQAHSYVVERLGAYHATWTTGVHIVIPFIDRVEARRRALTHYIFFNKLNPKFA